MLVAHPAFCLMTSGRLITNEMAYAASLRHWGKEDAYRLALAVAWGRYGEDDARAELATMLAWHAQNAGIFSVSCRELAASMLADELGEIEARNNAVRARMIDAAEGVLRANPQDRLGAANAAADIARDTQMPLELIDAAFNIALWRTRRRA